MNIVNQKIKSKKEIKTKVKDKREGKELNLNGKIAKHHHHRKKNDEKKIIKTI